MRLSAPLFLLVSLLTASAATAVSGQRPLEPVIVVFHDDAPFKSLTPCRVDARARVNPHAWQDLDPFVTGAVHLLERQYGFRCDHVYSAAVRAFAARLTPEQIDALQRDPLVHYIEPDGAMQSFAQTALKADAVATGTLSRDGKPVKLVYAGKY